MCDPCHFWGVWQSWIRDLRGTLKPVQWSASELIHWTGFRVPLKSRIHDCHTPKKWHGSHILWNPWWDLSHYKAMYQHFPLRPQVRSGETSNFHRCCPSYSYFEPAGTEFRLWRPPRCNLDPGNSIIESRPLLQCRHSSEWNGGAKHKTTNVR